MLRNELCGLGPQGRNRCRRIIKIDRKAVRLVMVRHVSEDVVIYVAEEMNLGLDSPVELHIRKRRMFIEKTAVPSAHLMVRFHAAILNIVLLKNLCRFLEELLIYPRWNVPVLFWY